MKHTILAILLIVVCFSFAPVIAAEEEPTLAFSTYFGGNGEESSQVIAVDDAGNVYIAGKTTSTNFPATNPFGATTPNMYVAKFDPTGQTLLFSIWLGQGSPSAIAVDALGYAYIAGSASNIPTVNPIQGTRNGIYSDAFIAKLNPSGTALVYSTYLGGSEIEYALGIALDPLHNVYMVGMTASPDFPTQNPYQADIAGALFPVTTSDAFVMKINSTGSALLYSTYYGGRSRDVGQDIVVDTAGNAYVTGYTESDDFPTVNPYQSQHGNLCAQPSSSGMCVDSFVAKFDPTGVPLYSTYLGGDGDFDQSSGIAVDSFGSAYVTGYTDSTNFPTVNAYQPMQPAINSAFITKFSPDGSQLEYSTYLGKATGDTSSDSISVNSLGIVYIAGITSATDFPTVEPIQAARAGTAVNYDMFIMVLDADGQRLRFSTYFGGSGYDGSYTPVQLTVDMQGNIYLTGTTLSSDFPLLNPFQSEPDDVSQPPDNLVKTEAFITKIHLGELVPLPEPTPTLPPPEPTPISPPDAATERNYFTTHTPTLTWKQVTWALGYQVQVSKNDLFTGTPDFEGETLAAADSITTTHLADGFYYWRILAQKPDGTWGNISPVDSFTIDAD